MSETNVGITIPHGEMGRRSKTLSIPIATIARMAPPSQQQIARMFFEAGFDLSRPIEESFDKVTEALVFTQWSAYGHEQRQEVTR